jgi:adenine phosphoribosyltransferase
MDLKNYIRTIPDFPKEGIMFRDITTLIGNAEGFKLALDQLIDIAKNTEFDVVAGLESRGFVFGAPIAYALGKPFIPIRKKGKLPHNTIEVSYDLEYGSSTLEMHVDAIKKGQKVLIIDDLIATGGSAKACAQLIEKLGGEVAKFLFVIELIDLNGREALNGYDVETLTVFEGE